MSRVSLFVKTDLLPNGESRTGLSHSDIFTSVDLIPTFDSFVVLWFSGQSPQQAKTVGTVVRERNQKRAGHADRGKRARASLQASEPQSNSTLLHEELETDRVQSYRRTVDRLKC